MMAGLYSAGFSPEVIVVAVGAPPDITPAEFQRRRSYDFIPSREEMSAVFADPGIGGARFALYTLFREPRAFARYLISSPAAYEPWLRMEEEWRALHDDLPAAPAPSVDPSTTTS